MRRPHPLFATIAATATVIVGASLSGFTRSDDSASNAREAVKAIQTVAPDSLSDLAPSTSSGTAAAQSTSPDGVSITVPVRAADGVKLTAPDGGGTVKLGLPSAQQASKDVPSPGAGVVVYDNNNGSSTVPVPHADGNVSLNTVIRNAHAPKRYDYPLTLLTGQKLRLNKDGSAVVLDAAGTRILGFAAPWAKDAKGHPVPTHYVVTGTTLTQVIAFGQSTAFPVVADPSVSYYSYNCVATNGSSYFLAPGAALSTCKGSRLQKYINGRLVQTIALTGYGQPGNPKAFGTPECYISLGAGLALSIYGIPGVLLRFLSGAIAFVVSTALPPITSCRG
ncbi:hypothetical protein [Leifsonia sp. 2MCAF36]|uniref:hypothetical protein n=1 Tax=Leifsonia sp. 2MCAF36 TaxID=3232988 RepID=UPI003F95EEA8